MQQRALVVLTESGTGTAVGEAIRGDRQPIAEAAVRGDGTVPVKLISPGWGSSGYYPAEMLERDGPKVFAAGTKMYWDHPTATEAAERPERSLRDLAGELVSAARWDPAHVDGPGLYAEAKVFSPFRESLDQLAPHIGVSIRASGTATQGEAEGRSGPIIDQLLGAMSVDFVTEAGRGGRILELFESLRPGAGRPRKLEEARNAGEWLEARLHLMFTEITDTMFGDGRLTRDERIALSSAIGVALDAFHGAVVERANPLFSRDPWQEPPPAAPITEGDKPVPHTPEELADLAEAKKAIESQADLQKQLDEAKAAAARASEALLVVAAEKAIGAELATVQLPAVTKARLVENLKANPPAKDGTLDTDALKTKVAEAVKAEVDYLAAVTGNAGGVRGLGGGNPLDGNDQVDAAEADKKLEAAFAGLGLSESAAKVAAVGRG
jgi:hypothetical protein